MTPSPSQDRGTGPTFVVVGAMKCATSTVRAYLEDHPDVFMVPRAEPNYFSDDAIWSQGPEAYEAHFRDAAGFAVRGEGSNDYANGARYPDAARRMAEYDPALKLVYMVRHPLDRMRSDWIQRRVDQGDTVPASLSEALLRQPEIFVDQSLYWKNLQRFRAHFPDAAIFLGFMEDVRADPEAFFASFTRFLEVPERAAERGHVNPSSQKRVPSAAYTRLNRSRAAGSLKRLLPARLKRAVKVNLLSVEARRTPRAEAALPPDILDVVRADARDLLRHAGRPESYWSLPG